MSEETVVGAFRLLEQVGRGGMGAVWRAEHVHQGVPAAVKFVTGKRAQDDAYRAQFRNEVETMASLHHRGIAMVFDYGESGQLAGHGISKGTQYLAMEWAPGGTLADKVPIPTWSRVRDIVLEILDALGHAHARNVIHRDLKPQNVLAMQGGALKLADFGLAFRNTPGERGGDGSNARAGSPRWMAPEQIRGTLRDQGPWTDLYGVGCLVFWLLTYRPPYHTGSVDDILRGHVEEPIPRLKSRIAVPHDIESWLRRLLAKDPSDRYRYAADAAHDLLQFADQISLAADDLEVADPHAIDTLPEDLLESELFGEEPLGLDEPSSYALFETSPMPIRLEPRPLPPRSWARSEPPEPPMALVGAGLGLWGLRPPPMVDRETERDALWNALREVHRTRRASVVSIHGAAGTGKTRLSQWLMERAVELGAAHVVRATHDALGTPQDGLAGAVASWFRAYGLDTPAIQARVRTEFESLQHTDEHLDVHALSELVEAATSGQITPTADARERWLDAWLRYLEPATRDRPLVMVFDDVQWGADSLAFIAQALDETVELPILFVLTARDEALSERPVERARLAALTEQHGTVDLAVEPLAEGYRLDLVHRLLHLAPAVAAEVAARSQGNPLFAVQLTDDWVQRGLLEVSETGFVLTSGAPADLPDELRLVWTSRLERFLTTCENRDAARAGIEIGAALGQAPSNATWRDVCHRANVPADPALIDALARDGLVRRRPGGWAFCHAMFREAIEATSRAEGRGEKWHSHCADQLQATFGNVSEVAELQAGHLVAASRFEEALPRILAAAEVHARTSQFDRVTSMFAWYDAALALIDRDTTADRIRGDLHRVRNSLFEANVDEMEPILAAAEAAVDSLDDRELHAEVLFVRSRLSRFRGQPDAAVAPAELARDLLQGTANKRLLALVHRSLGELFRALGRLNDARASYNAARTLFEELNDDFQLGWCEFGLATTAKEAANDKAYVQHFEAAATSFEHSRSYGALGCAYNEKAEWLRVHGRLDEALEVYGDSLRILPSNHSEVGVAQFNLALVHIAQEAWGPARDWLRQAQQSFERLGRLGATTYVDLARLVCAAGERRWAEVEGLAERIEPVIRERRLTNQDVASLLLRAGDLCQTAGEFRRARMFWELSRVHWDRLSRVDEVKLVDERLSDLTTKPDN